MPERTRPVQLWLVLILASLPVLVYLLVMSARKAIEVYEIREQQEAVRTDIARLKDNNVALRQQLDYLHTDAYVEYAARRSCWPSQAAPTPSAFSTCCTRSRRRWAHACTSHTLTMVCAERPARRIAPSSPPRPTGSGCRSAKRALMWQRWRPANEARS